MLLSDARLKNSIKLYMSITALCPRHNFHVLSSRLLLQEGKYFV
jgi:hypothetical protein